MKKNISRRLVRLLEADISDSDKRAALQAAVSAKMSGAWLCDVYEEYAIFEVIDAESKLRLFNVNYSLDEAGTATLTDAVEVKRVTSYEPVADAPAIVLPTPDDGFMEGAEVTALQGELVPLCEAAAADLGKGKALIKVIAPGWNSAKTKFYPAEVLKRDLPGALPKGFKMFADHRPRVNGKKTEGSIDRLAAQGTDAAFYMENGPDGPGGYANVQLIEAWRAPLAALKDSIGTSIDLAGILAPGERDGHRGQIVQSIFNDNLPSVDFVATPGADGKIISLTEAAQPFLDASRVIPQEGNAVTEQEAQELRDKNTRLETEVATLRESAVASGKTALAARLPGHLTDEKRAELVETIAPLALDESGTINEAALSPLLEAMTPTAAPGVRNLGAPPTPKPTPKTNTTPPEIAAMRAGLGR